MRVGIIGAGLAGLGAARTLTKEGAEVVIFEASEEVGGRCETRTIGGYTFDTGVTSIAPRGKSIEPVMLEELDTAPLVRIEAPIYAHNGARVMPGDSSKNRIARYTYSAGNATLPNLLSEGLDVRLESHVARFQKSDRGYELNGESFDALIVTPPAPASEQLLAASGERRSLAQASYRPCLSVLLGFELPPPTTAYHALIEPEQRHPLTWLSLESVKSPGRAPEGCTAMVAQMSPSYSRQEYEDTDELIVRDTLAFIARLFGPKWNHPVVQSVKRWKHSLPESLALFDTVNPKGSKLVIAGDGLLGGRVEFAYETGVLAARSLLENK